jgi:hypothetical protein
VSYCTSMARGWESKGVESQISQAQEQGESHSATTEREAEAADRRREREGLEMSRKRILNELSQARNSRHIEALQAALNFLDEKLNSLTAS